MKQTTQCLGCETEFFVTQRQLDLQQGWVRCGQCGVPFNAIDPALGAPEPPAVKPPGQAAVEDAAAREDVPPAEPEPEREPEPEPEEDQTPADGMTLEDMEAALIGIENDLDATIGGLAEPDAEVDSETPAEPAASLSGDSMAGEPTADDSIPEVPILTPEPKEPAEPGVDEAKSAAATRSRFWLPGVSLLAALLVWQSFDRFASAWSQSPAVRPAMLQWCAWFNCEVPPRRDFRRIELAGTSIAVHEQVAGALRITIQLINRADFPQAYPALEISLTDQAGDPVGRRTLSPEQFLGPGNRQRKLPSRQLTSVIIDLADPPSNALGYEVKLIDFTSD